MNEFWIVHGNDDARRICENLFCGNDLCIQEAFSFWQMIEGRFLHEFFDIFWIYFLLSFLFDFTREA